MRNLLTAAAMALAMASAQAQSTLHARDIDGDGSIDAFYDSQQDLTWLADANYAGRMTQNQSVAWAGQLDVHGITDWRLPLLLDAPIVNPVIGAPPGTPCTDISGWLFLVGPNEMTVLFDQLAGSTVPFLNVQDAEYWTGSNFGSNNGWAAYAAGGSRASGRTDELSVPVYAWAVRDGDVTLAVPEPSTYALMLLGLAVVSIRRVLGLVLRQESKVRRQPA